MEIDLHNAAEKAWCATVRAVDALVLTKTAKSRVESTITYGKSSGISMDTLTFSGISLLLANRPKKLLNGST